MARKKEFFPSQGKSRGRRVGLQRFMGRGKRSKAGLRKGKFKKIL